MLGSCVIILLVVKSGSVIQSTDLPQFLNLYLYVSIKWMDMLQILLTLAQGSSSYGPQAKSDSYLFLEDSIFYLWLLVFARFLSIEPQEFTLGPLQKFSEACCSLSLLCQWGAWALATTIYPIICWYLADTQKASESLTYTTVTYLPARVSVYPPLIFILKRRASHMLFFSGYIASPFHYVTNL